MIINCKDTSKMAAKISPQETAIIKNYLKRAVTDFCAVYYDELYYERWFSLNTVFQGEYFYKQKPINAVYDYYINIGKNENDAKIFALLDLNCLLEEILAKSDRVYTKKTNDTKYCLPSYMPVNC